MRWRWSAIVVVLVGVVELVTGAAGWFSDEQPPAGAKPLSEIIKALEDQNIGVITEVELDGGVWKIEVHHPDGSESDLKVDPISGQIRSRE
jgi:hypothetical protein